MYIEDQRIKEVVDRLTLLSKKYDSLSNGTERDLLRIEISTIELILFTLGIRLDNLNKPIN